jgi:hypothetical protein
MSELNAENWLKVFSTLNENQRRWYAAHKAIELGHGGITEVRNLTGMSRTTIMKGIEDLKASELSNERIRREGGGRKCIKVTNENIIAEIEGILDENTAGDPMSFLKWTSKSVRNIASELQRKGYSVSYGTVYSLLKDSDYSLQENKKTLGNCDSSDRDGQFRYINSLVKKFIKNNEPVISVDTKKKELVGKFKNNGRIWRKKKQGKAVNDHDYKSLGKGVAIPYGMYDIERNEGFVNVGTSVDNSEFSVNSIRQWWKLVGKQHYSKSKNLLICADGGGSNGSRNRLWKAKLQELSDEIGKNITVCHYPPGTSKWNKIEHKMFSFISMNWRGVPLESYEMVINLISGTKTTKGLKVEAKLDKKQYYRGIKVSDKEFERVNISSHKKYPKWNYTIKTKRNK